MHSPRYPKAEMMPVRQSEERYVSLPCTPLYGVDPRPQDMALALEHARLGLEAPDYFSGAGRFGCNVRPRSPFPNVYDHERLSSHSYDVDVNEVVRRCAVLLIHVTNWELLK